MNMQYTLQLATRLCAVYSCQQELDRFTTSNIYPVHNCEMLKWKKEGKQSTFTLRKKQLEIHTKPFVAHTQSSENDSVEKKDTHANELWKALNEINEIRQKPKRCNSAAMFVCLCFFAIFYCCHSRAVAPSFKVNEKQKFNFEITFDVGFRSLSGTMLYKCSECTQAAAMPLMLSPPTTVPPP